MKSSDWDRWKQAWKHVDQIALWGYGKTCGLHLSELKRSFLIHEIFDNDKDMAGTIAEGIPVTYPDPGHLKDRKIVITTHYEEVSQQLIHAGMKEYIDFCDLRLFLSGKAWQDAEEVVISELHIAVTTGCTLNCRYCNMFMPFHKKHVDMIPLERLKTQLALLFTHIDRVVNLVLIGGETLLYQELAAAIEYVDEHYSERVGNLEIVTNGTVIPPEPLLQVLQKKNVLVSISDYRLNDAYDRRLAELEQIFSSRHIRHYVSPNLQWKDFSFPYGSLYLTDSEAYRNMDLCNPVFRGFNDSKLYFCHLVWSADKAGIFKEKDTDYLDFTTLKKRDREKIVRLNICCHDQDYVSLCRECGGCSNQNRRFVPVGEQL